MAFFVKNSQKDRLQFLSKQSPEGTFLFRNKVFVLTLQILLVLVDFCKLALEYLGSGPNEKKYTIAARKIEEFLT